MVPSTVSYALNNIESVKVLDENSNSNEIIEENLSEENTEEDIENAKELYQTAIDEIEGSESEIIASYYMIELLGVDTIETKAKKMKEVTKKEIIKVAKKVKIDTVYMLEGVLK